MIHSPGIAFVSARVLLTNPSFLPEEFIAVYETESSDRRRAKDKMKRTCAYPICPSPESRIEPGSTRVDIEPRELKKWPLQPVADWNTIQQSPWQEGNLRGRAEMGVLWMHLSCWKMLEESAGVEAPAKRWYGPSS